MNVKVTTDILYDRIHELFEYYDDGYLVWKCTRKGTKCKKDDIAGGLHKGASYYKIKIDGVNYLLHIIIFLYHHGYLPENDIDHIDKDKTNNRIENLREVSHQCNSRNAKPMKNNTSGVKGVGFHKRINKWYSSIIINGVNNHLGYFTDFIDAVKARYYKEVELNWNGCNTTSCSYLYLKNIGEI